MKKSCKFLSFICLIIVLSLTGCSFNGGRTVTAYVDNVREDMRQVVNITRELRKELEGLDCRKKDEAQSCIEKLDTLCSLYDSLSKLEAPDRYTDLDSELKAGAGEAMSRLSGLKSLMTSAMNTGNDELYRSGNKEIMEEYNQIIDDLVDVSSRITTRFRND